MTQLCFRLDRRFAVSYAVLALGFSILLLAQATRRGTTELAVWLLAYVAVGIASTLRPRAGPLAAGLLAFLLGFDRTYCHGINLNLGLCLILLAVGLELLQRTRRLVGPWPLDLAGLCLLAVSGWSVVSCGVTLVRIRSFAPAPGFGYHVYRFNLLGQSSEEALVAALAGAAATFAGLGLYDYARSTAFDRRWLRGAVFVALLANSAALLVQRYVEPGFLHPAGLPQIGRSNGLTSFCYALGDVTSAVFLLLPVWGAARGLAGLLTLASVALLGHSVVASGSRSALLAVAAALLLWTFLRGVRLALGKRPLAAAALFAAALALPLGLAIAYRVTPPDQSTPLGRLKAGVEAQGFVGHLFATRLSGYPLIFSVLREYPLAGVGVGLYRLEIDKQRALLRPQLRIHDPLLMTSFAPNQFLNTGVELGLPALIALVTAFACAGWAAVSSPARPRSLDLAVSLLVLVLTLLLGPSLYNSEALVFCWLIVGLAGQGAAPAQVACGERGSSRGSRATAALLAALLLLGVTGQWLSGPRLAIDSQWRRLRWPMNIAMQPKQPDGQWTSSEATFTVDVDAPALLLRWHAGDAAAPRYQAFVSFFVDGVLAEKSIALGGRIRESTLALPPAHGRRRISIRVTPPFVPAQALGGDDHRRLGVFVHAVLPAAPGR